MSNTGIKNITYDKSCNGFRVNICNDGIRYYAVEDTIEKAIIAKQELFEKIFEDQMEDTPMQIYRRYIIINMPYIVLRVLLKHGVLTEYLNHCVAKQSIADLGFDLTMIAKSNNNPMIWLDWGMNWSKTTEGYQFWKFIKDEIQKEYTEKSLLLQFV